MYYEEIKTGNKYRQSYLDGVNKLISDRQKQADIIRQENYNKMSKNPDEYRQKLYKMLGWPLTELNHEMPKVTMNKISHKNGMSIYRVQVNILGDLQFYGMYFKHDGEKKRPFVVSQHGGMGTPERCSGLFQSGTRNYNDMTMRLFNKDVNVFAPQLLLWNKDEYEIPFERVAIDAKLKQLGSSITAVEVYAIMKSIDFFVEQPENDPEKVGMVGLSYGGFYTMYTAAADTRIKAAISCSQYNNRYMYSWEDWTWRDSAYYFLDNEIAALIYPRYFCIEVGNTDELFDVNAAKEEYYKLCKMTENNKWVDFRVFDGVHEFYHGSEDIEKFIDVINN